MDKDKILRQNERLKEFVAHVSWHGPCVVIVDEEGTLIKCRDAKQHDIAVEIIVIRADGVTIGAPINLSQVAFDTQAPNVTDWLAFLVDGDPQPHEMSEWSDRERLLDEAHRLKGQRQAQKPVISTPHPMPRSKPVSVPELMIQNLPKSNAPWTTHQIAHWTIAEMRAIDNFPYAVSIVVSELLTSILCSAESEKPLSDDTELELQLRLIVPEKGKQMNDLPYNPSYRDSARNAARIEHARKYGPKRILVDGDGSLVSFLMAVQQYNITWEIILLREDGWTIGCQFDLAPIAFNLWPDQWIGFIVDGDPMLYDMGRWSEHEKLLDAAHGAE